MISGTIDVYFCRAFFSRSSLSAAAGCCVSGSRCGVPWCAVVRCGALFAPTKVENKTPAGQRTGQRSTPSCRDSTAGSHCHSVTGTLGRRALLQHVAAAAGLNSTLMQGTDQSLGDLPANVTMLAPGLVQAPPNAAWLGRRCSAAYRQRVGVPASPSTQRGSPRYPSTWRKSAPAELRCQSAAHRAPTAL